MKNLIQIIKTFFQKIWSIIDRFIIFPLTKLVLKISTYFEESSKKASDLINAEIIPTGDIVQLVRETISEFDYKNGGLSLCRDSFHLSEDYGRFLAGAVWFKKLTGKTLKEQPFSEFDYEKVKKLITIVNEKV